MQRLRTYLYIPWPHKLSCGSLRLAPIILGGADIDWNGYRHVRKYVVHCEVKLPDLSPATSSGEFCLTCVQTISSFALISEALDDPVMSVATIERVILRLITDADCVAPLMAEK